MCIRDSQCCSPPIRQWQAEEEGDGLARLFDFVVSGKWSKGKQKEKWNNSVLFDHPTYDKLLSKVPKYKQTTPSVLSERLRVTNPSFQIF
ncbi:hypothetical protein BAE44_0001170, partial [Dichanthelium oligosanthes]